MTQPGQWLLALISISLARSEILASAQSFWTETDPDILEPAANKYPAGYKVMPSSKSRPSYRSETTLPFCRIPFCPS
jgi:hypothetical protein